MHERTDETGSLSRSALCELAEIERGRHLRWTTKLGLLADRDRFTTLDLARAAMLDELNTMLKPAKAVRVWRRIRDDIGLPGRRLEVVVDVATCDATVCRTDDELLVALTRGTTILIIVLHERAQRALHRLRTLRESEPEDPAAPADVTQLRERDIPA